MHFAEVTKDDQETLATFIRRFFDEEPDLQIFTQEEARRRAGEIISLSNKLVHPLFICRHDKEVIGYALMVSYYSNEFGGLIAMLDEFFIVPESRSHGIGSEALDKIKTWALDHGYTGITLEVTDANPKARLLYDRHDFVALPRKIMAWFPEPCQN